MNREILYRYFEGLASLQEEQQIKQWLEEDKANMDFLKEERVSFDALLLNAPDALNKRRKKRNQSALIKMQSVAAIVLLCIATGIYLFIGAQKNTEVAYNTISVPVGQHIDLVLADQTKVWLNSNTTFKYPTKFSKKDRVIYLDGEAYFEVAENKRKPFIVQTLQGDVHVTGTHFNVEAYSCFNQFETSLFEGGVDIYRNNTKMASLHPNQKSVLKNNILSVVPITDPDEYLWKEGLIVFNNKKLEDILIELEKYFDIHIQINMSNIPSHTYTGKFRQSDGIDYALKVLQKSINFSYKRNETEQIIYIH